MQEGGLRHRVGRSAGREDLVVEREPRLQPGGRAGVDDAADGVALQDPRCAPESHRLRERGAQRLRAHQRVAVGRLPRKPQSPAHARRPMKRPKRRRRRLVDQRRQQRNFAFQWLEKVHVKKGAAAPMLQLNTEAHHEAVNEELSHIASGGCFTSGRLGGEPPAKRPCV